MEANKKHGMIITVSSIVLLLSLAILSEGWSQQYSFMQNIGQIYLYVSYGEMYVTSDFYLRTKYFMILCIAAIAYGWMVHQGVLSDPFSKKNNDQS